MTEEQQKKELEIALTSYIALKHTQEECVGFIDGFKEALSLFDVSGRSELLLDFGNFIASDTANLNYTPSEWVEMFLASNSH